MKIQLAALALSLLCFGANATLITYEVNVQDENVILNDAKANFDNLTTNNGGSVDMTSTLSAFTSVFPGVDTSSHLSIEFSPIADSVWNFEFGLDARHGAAIYLNGSEITSDYSNVWWDSNWDVAITTGDLNILAGLNTIDVYWAEECCNGLNSARFSSDLTDTNYSLSSANIAAAEVSEPGSLAMLGLGLIALGLRRRLTK